MLERSPQSESFRSHSANPLLPSGGGFSLDWLWMMILRRWPILAAAVAISVGLGLAWLAVVTPMYTASAQLLLDARKHKLVPGQEVVSDTGLDASSVATEVALLRSFAIATRVVEAHGLDRNSDFSGRTGGSASPMRLVRSIFNALFGASDATSSPIEQVDAPAEAKADPAAAARKLAAIRAVQNATAVRRVATTFFLEVSFTHQNPAMAALVANAVAESYLNEVHEAKFQSTRRSTLWLAERAAQLGIQVQASERAVAEHRAKFGLLSARPASLSEQQAGEINTQLVTARAQSVEKKAKFEQARSILDSGRIDSLAEAMASPVILNLRNSEAVAAREEADLLTRYGVEHPTIVKMRAQRQDLRRQIAAELNRVVSALKTDFELAVAREKSLERSLGEMHSDSQPVIRLRELEREVNANKALFEALLTRSKEAEQQSGAPTAESRVIAPALAPVSPSSPNRSGILLLALFGGAGLGVALAFVLDQIERGLLTVEQTEQVLQLPVLSIVQELGQQDRLFEGRPVAIPEIVWRKPLSRFGEAIRTVRVSTQMSDIDNPPRLVMVTSALPSEGKSMLIQSVAYSAATSGRVLLIDCDLRHPSTTHAFQLDNNPGLTDLLAGQAQPHSVLVAGPVPNLTILPAGSTARHPPDVLGSEKLASLLQIVRGEYDLVLIDAPPVTPVVDASLLAKRVDKILFVVRWRTTPHDVVTRALSTLDVGRQKIAGVVLNSVQLHKMSGYSKNYAYYKNSYDKYYTE